MGVKTLTQILAPAIGQPWAVGAYDVVNIAMIEGVLDAAVEDRAPIIFLVYPNSVPVNYFRSFAEFIRREAAYRDVDTAIMLDHGNSFAQVKAAIDAKFTGVMIDASTLSFEENVALTSKIVQYAHKHNVSVEAELGHVGEGNDGLSTESRREQFTDVARVCEFIEYTKVDALAISIGTAHGVYHFKPNLDVELLQRIRSQTNIGLVLHGSSGTPEDQIKAAIKTGIDKLNVYTDIRVHVLNEIGKLLKTQPAAELDIVDIDNVIRNKTKEIVQDKNKLFGSTGIGPIA